MTSCNPISLGAVHGAAAIALALAGCSSLAGAPSSAAGNAAFIRGTLSLNGRPVTAAHVNLSPLPRYATIVPDRHKKSRTYEYVINTYGSYASIFDYPKSVRQIGSINNVGGQGCTNVLYGYGKKTFWIVAGATTINEYQVPRKPIKTLSVPYSFPTSCAMDAGGDLAVGIYGTDGGGDVLIFKNASGTPKAYSTPMDEEFFDGYDNNGNLFADGFTGNRFGFALTELPKGGTKFVTIKTSNSVQFPGSVQWDGTYLTVFDQLANATYQYTVSGTTATLKHTVTLNGSSDCAQTWIVKGLLYCGDAGNDDGEVFKYPAGGSPIATFTGNFDTPLGVVAAAI
ncbi:MAG TPA: hypothetical protein VIW73_13950 [Candidatus Cybelea sp.]